MNDFINIRVFADVSSEEEAYSVGIQLSNKLMPLGKTQICNVKKYWKMPEYFEFSIELRSLGLNQSNCQEIVQMLGGDWVEAGGDFIWNPTDNFELAHPRVKWAHIEFIEAE